MQPLRVEEAKRRLERTDEPIDKISWAVGYEDPAFFRRCLVVHVDLSVLVWFFARAFGSN